MAASPLLQGRGEFARLAGLSSIDVMAVRLWLDRRVPLETASNVAVGFDDGVGATFFCLNTLQVKPLIWEMFDPRTYVGLAHWHVSDALNLTICLRNVGHPFCSVEMARVCCLS